MQPRALLLVLILMLALVLTARAEPPRVVVGETGLTLGHSAVHQDKFYLEQNQALNGRIADTIVKEAKAWPAGLIVVGTHGRRGLSHLFLGSVAEGVMRTAPAPVLLIRAA